MIGKKAFKIICAVVRAGMFLWHPSFRVYGRENIPKDGSLLICPNHSGMADPFWVIFALRPDRMPRVMAKKELMSVPVLGGFLRWLGVFGVDRGGNDVNAIKNGLKCLRDGERLLLFPEGTRVKPGQDVKPKGGAVLLAHRTDSPILPVYISPRRGPFCPVTCVIGEPFKPELSVPKPREDELLAASEKLMQRVYSLGEASWK